METQNDCDYKERGFAERRSLILYVNVTALVYFIGNDANGS